MANYNKVILMGNLTRDPEVRFTNNEMAICKIGLAVNRRYKDSASGEWKEQPNFIDVTIFGRRGEAFAKYHQKGSSAFIEGSLRMDTWEDKQTGQKRSKLYVVADDWEFVGGGRGAGSGGGRDHGSGGGYEDRSAGASGGSEGGGGADFLEVDDTPFSRAPRRDVETSGVDLTVRLFAVLRERAGTGELVLAGLPEELTVGELKAELERRHPELGSLRHVAGVLGTAYVADDATVAPGVEVALLPPVSGGAPSRAGDAATGETAFAEGVFELCPGALDPAACAERVRDDGCGAVVTFVGATREENRGQRVVRLEYEAFEAMTGPEMARIFTACRAEVAGADPARRLRMLCQHRVGVVTVGEPSVVIAVASPHRDAAFAACRFLIDRLKDTLPVWKKEVYSDGHHWIGDRS